MRLGRFNKVLIGRAVGGAAGLVVLAYLILVVINWSDQAPSDTTISFSSLYENRPRPSDTNNAYTFMLGFVVPPDADPYELGLRRQAWIESFFDSPRFEVGPDPANQPYGYRSERPPDVLELARACNAGFAGGTREFYAGCTEALIGSDSVVSQWLDSEEWLLDRYINMIALTGYREMPFDQGIPLPPLTDISDIRALLFMRALVAGESGNADLVESLLQRDLVFWRMVLADSEHLITKMVAVSAVIDHFRMANLIVSHLQRDGLNVRMPSSWQAEISDAERSMERSFIGEWRYFDRVMKRMRDDAQQADIGVWNYVFWRAVSPFWQPQDLSNRHAEGMAHYINLFAAPYDSIRDALSQAQRVPAVYARPFSRAYNLTGDINVAHGFPDFSDYGVRVADLEGIRRAAVAAWRLRAEGVAIEDVESRLPEREWVNPYTNDPLEWDTSTNEIVFQGLQYRDRGRYAFPY